MDTRDLQREIADLVRSVEPLYASPPRQRTAPTYARTSPTASRVPKALYFDDGSAVVFPDSPPTSHGIERSSTSSKVDREPASFAVSGRPSVCDYSGYNTRPSYASVRVTETAGGSGGGVLQRSVDDLGRELEQTRTRERASERRERQLDVKLRTLESERSEAVAEAGSLRASLVSAREALKSLHTKNAELRTEKEKLAASLADARREIETRKHADSGPIIDNLRAQLREWEERKSELESERVRAERDRENMRAKHRAAVEEVDLLRREREGLRVERRGLIQERDMLRKCRADDEARFEKLTAALAELPDARKDRENLLSEIDTLDAWKSRAEDTIAGLESQLARLSDTLSSERESFMRERSEWGRERDRLDAVIAAAVAEADTRASESASKQAEVDQLRETERMWKTEKVSLLTQKAELDSVIRSTRTELENARTDYTAHIERLTASGEREREIARSAAKERENLYESEVKSLKSALEEARRRATAAEEQRAKTQQALTQTEAALHTARSESVSEVDRCTQERDSVVAGLVAKHEQEKRELREARASALTACQDAQGEVARLLAYKSRVESMRTELEVKDRQIAQLESEVSALHKKIRAGEEVNASLKTQLGDMESGNIRLSGRVSDAERTAKRVSELEDTVAAKESELKALERELMTTQTERRSARDEAARLRRERDQLREDNAIQRNILATFSTFGAHDRTLDRSAWENDYSGLGSGH